MKTFIDDPRADDALAACTAQVAEDIVAAQDCFRAVATRHAGSLAAVKAEASLAVLARQGAATPGLIPAGRLGVTAASGLFGVWNGAAAGWIAAANGGAVDQTALIGVTGIGAVVLGAAMGSGGYFLAEKLKLDEGAARLLASSLVWGTVVGVGVAPTIVEAFDTANGSGFAASVGVVAVVGMGYLGAGAALLATSLTTFDEAQVSMLNSGGVAGSLVGMLILPALSSFRVINALPYSAAFVGSTVGGLALGAGLGRTLDLTWGETLLCDLGLVLGGVLGGTASFVVSPSTSSLDYPTRTVITSVLPAVGLLGGYGAALAFVTSWRAGRGAPVWREAPRLRTIAAAVPVGAKLVPIWGLAGDF
jgi:hypothetical protein